MFPATSWHYTHEIKSEAFDLHRLKQHRSHQLTNFTISLVFGIYLPMQVNWSFQRKPWRCWWWWWWREFGKHTYTSFRPPKWRVYTYGSTWPLFTTLPSTGEHESGPWCRLLYRIGYATLTDINPKSLLPSRFHIVYCTHHVCSSEYK